MIRRFRQLGAALALALVCGQPAVAWMSAPAPATPPVVTDARPHADKVSLEEAVRRVRQQYGGRIISAETRGSGARKQHVIKVLTKSGHVRTVRIPAN